MAKILENSYGGRRMIRLSGEDIMMVVSMFQREFRDTPATPVALKEKLGNTPFYLPEEIV